MKYSIIQLILLLSLILGIQAQTPSAQKSSALSAGSPKSVGLSEERLARIDAMAESAIKDGDVPGVVALVARNGKIVYHKAFGLADNSSGREMKKDDIFRIASQSKAITSTGVMMLWEEGLFKLDDPVSKCIRPASHHLDRGFDPRYSWRRWKQTRTKKQ